MRADRGLLNENMNNTNYHILEFLEEWAPQSTKLEYDNVGLLIGDESQEITKAVVCLDVTPEVIEEAIAVQADLILAHHPLIFRKLSRVTLSDPIGAMIYRLIRHGISLIVAHTNLDAAREGVSFVLAKQLGLQDIRFLTTCNGSAPHAAKSTVESGPISGFGTLGEYPEPLDSHTFLKQVQTRLNSVGLRYSGNCDQIRKVAVCGGSGFFLADEVLKQNADAFVTADLKYHDFFSLSPSFVLVDAGHYESEVPIVRTLCTRLTDRFPELEVLCTSVNTNPVKYFNNETPTMKKRKPANKNLC